MTILDLLKKAAFAGDELLAFLLATAQKAPDLAPKALELAAELTAAIQVDNLIRVASVLPGEIADIAQGKIDPREHPSDSI